MSRFSAPFPLVALGALIALGTQVFAAEENLLRQPLKPAKPASEGGKPFTTLPASYTGISAVNTYDDPKMWNELFREFTLGAVGTGVTIGDYDGDGHPDVAVVGKTSGVRLYRQTGDLQFTDVTEAAGLVSTDKAWCTGATFADVNNDGLLDLYVCRFNAPNLLFINQGNGSFKEQAQAYGLAIKDASVMASFADYDRDGYLDLYLQTNILNYAASFKGRPNYLFHNNGNGTFTDVTAKAGIWGPTQGHSAVWWDFNEDGWPDIYVANDFENPDRLYRNNGDGTFTDVVEAVTPHTSYSSMGSDAGDINNDGHLDFFVADMAATTHYKDMMGIEEMGRGIWEGEMARALCPQYPFNALYLNNGAGRFFEVAHLAGLRATDWTWAARFVDLDNDGRVDLYVTNGMIRNFMDADLLDKQNVASNLAQRAGIYAKAPTYTENHLAYRNLGDLRFESVGPAWGLDHPGVSFGAAFADLDRDGDLDLIFTNYEGAPTVVRNDSPSRHSLLIRLVGTTSNRWGVGARVVLETAAGPQVRELSLTRGIMSSDEPLLHFGLGDLAKVNRLIVYWPSGQVQTFDEVAANQLLTITEPAGAAKLPPAKGNVRSSNATATVFHEVTKQYGLEYTDHEVEVDEFTRQVLLPRRLSDDGPGVAVGRVSSQVADEIVLPGTIFTKQDNGWKATEGPDSTAASALVPLLFEANGDGHPDLYLVAGGVRHRSGEPGLQDKLYFGDEKGNFTPAPADALPANTDSSGVVIAGDFDGDGRLDLFVGGRVVPQQYPKTPHSALLHNVGGRFVEVTDQVAPGLATVGLVTAALWSDVDGDGRLDLLVATEWGPICYFHNNGKQLVNETEKAGLSKMKGWWTSINGADVNGDGKIDYLVGNFGLNTKYHADQAHPVVMYSGDLDGTGKPGIAEAMYEGDKLFPVRGKSKVGYAFPFVRKKFKTFDEFARADMDAIFGPERLAAAQRLEVTQLASGILINQGGTFLFKPLPTLAQVAPIFGSALQDFDGDGIVDLCVAQNFYGPEPKTGRFDGGVSLFLKGDGAGGFTALWPLESGILVPGDAKGLATLDLNNDGRPDLLITQNAGPLVAYENQGNAASKGGFSVGLTGSKGNPDGIGARIAVKYRSGKIDTRELYAGSGHGSQSAPRAFFGLPGGDTPIEISVRWPGGKTTQTRWKEGQGPQVTIKGE